MTAEEISGLERMVNALANAFKHTLTPDGLGVWVQALSGFRLEDVASGLESLTVAARRWPLPGEAVDAVRLVVGTRSARDREKRERERMAHLAQPLTPVERERNRERAAALLAKLAKRLEVSQNETGEGDSPSVRPSAFGGSYELSEPSRRV